MCNNCGCNVRSCSTTYTNSNQTVTEAVTTLSILGGEVTSTGKCINAQASGFSVKASGLYRIGFDVTLDPTAAGTAVIQMTKDGVAMPEAVATVTTVANALVTVHVETTRYIAVPCHVNSPAYGVVSSGVAGTVTHVTGYAVKLDLIKMKSWDVALKTSKYTLTACTLSSVQVSYRHLRSPLPLGCLQKPILRDSFPLHKMYTSKNYI